MNQQIKTCNNQWRDRTIILCGTLGIICLIFIGYIIYVERTNQEIKENINDLVEESKEFGIEYAVDYITTNKIYPVKYKGNKDIIWIKKEELCKLG